MSIRSASIIGSVTKLHSLNITWQCLHVCVSIFCFFVLVFKESPHQFISTTETKCSDLNEFLAFQIQKRIEENAAAGRDTASLDDEAFTIEAALDRCILRLIASCCNGEPFIGGSLGGNFFPPSKLGYLIWINRKLSKIIFKSAACFCFHQVTSLWEPLNLWNFFRWKNQ